MKIKLSKSQIKNLESIEYSINPDKLKHKGYSMCFVEKEADILKVENILKEICEFEFSYMPNKNWDRGGWPKSDYDHWISVYKGSATVTRYTGKFDPDLSKLYKRCKEENINILVIDDLHEDACDRTF